jgi:hypothetical protein
MKMQDVTTPYYETPNPSNMPEMPGTKCDDMSDTKSPWLDKPDGPDWWWHDHITGSEPHIHMINKAALDEDRWPGGRWQRVQPPREE